MNHFFNNQGINFGMGSGLGTFKCSGFRKHVCASCLHACRVVLLI